LGLKRTVSVKLSLGELAGVGRKTKLKKHLAELKRNGRGATGIIIKEKRFLSELKEKCLRFKSRIAVLGQTTQMGKK
jgi:hypothetical protein